MLGIGSRLNREFRVYEMTPTGPRLRWSRILPIRPAKIDLDRWLDAAGQAAVEAGRILDAGGEPRIVTPGDSIPLD